MKPLFFVLLFGAALLASVASLNARGEPIPLPPSNGTVELHAHLFMKEGMGLAFKGDFFGPLRATSWRDQFRSQANPETLDKSGLSIVVASLYSHPLLVWSLRDAIREQIRLARKFVLSRPDWVIATEPEQAQEALLAGKHVMILALEGASGILETEEDLREFIDEGGIRIVGPLHLTDDEFGGVAFLRGIRVLANPIAWLASLFFPKYAEDVKINHSGLTDEGRAFIRKLLLRHVWIDLAHASDISMNEIMKMIEEANQPLLYTHTVLRKFHRAERGLSQAELARIAKSGGIVGLMPSEDFLEGAPRTAECPSALSALKMEYVELAAALGNDSVMLGSDYNGGIPHLAPGCNSGAKIDTEGLWNIGQSSDVWAGLKGLGAPTPEPLSKMTQKFIKAWKKVQTAVF